MGIVFKFHNHRSFFQTITSKERCSLEEPGQTYFHTVPPIPPYFRSLQVSSEAGVLKKFSLAGLAKLSQLRYS
jgi:hypothetical protein